MRRWLIWTGGILLALAAAFAVLLFSVPEAPPFPFLRGHQPVAVRYTQAELAEMRKQRKVRRVYSFHGHYEDLVPVVGKELAAKDLHYSYVGLHSLRYRVYQWRPFKTPRDWLPGETNHQVTMIRDVKATGKGDDWEEAGHWITFIVDTPEAPSLFDNLRSWLGL